MQELVHVTGHQHLWAEAMNTSNYLRNRLDSSACHHPSKTPYEFITGIGPNLAHIRRFSAKSYVHVPKKKCKGKFVSRARVGYLVGFANGNRYKVQLPDTNSIVVSRDVEFDERSAPVLREVHAAVPKSNESSVISFDANPMPDNSDPEDIPRPPHDGSVTSHKESAEGVTSEDATGEPLLNQDSVTHYPNCPRIGRVVKPPEKYSDTSALIALSVRIGNEEASVPTSYTEAIRSDNSAEWNEAMESEIAEIEKNSTWILEQLPKGAKAIGNKWVYANKTDSQGNLTRRRALLVAKGFSQRLGIDYNETFASVASYSTLRVLLSIVASQNMEYLQLDVKSAFSDGELEEEIYMKQPEGFIDAERPSWAYRLIKALYGLKQASRVRRKLVHKFLVSFRFKPSELDPCLYVCSRSGFKTYILVYVDYIYEQTYGIFELGSASREHCVVDPPCYSGDTLSVYMFSSHTDPATCLRDGASLFLTQKRTISN